MKDSNAHQLSPEVAAFIESLNQAEAIAPIMEVLEQLIDNQIQNYLAQFQNAIAHSNATAVDLMQEEIARMKEESATVKGVLERLKAAATPDLPLVDEEITTFRQAIHNLKKYGVILPTSTDILAAQLRVQKNHAWSLFWQSVVRLVINKMEKIINVRH